MNWLFEFFFPNRLHRLAYFFRVTITDIVVSFLYASTMVSGNWLWMLIIALGVYQLFFVVLPRLRDVNMSGWWLLFMFVPVADIVLGLILLFRAPVLLTHPKSKAKFEPVYSGVDDVL